MMQKCAVIVSMMFHCNACLNLRDSHCVMTDILILSYCFQLHIRCLIWFQLLFFCNIFCNREYIVPDLRLLHNKLVNLLADRLFYWNLHNISSSQLVTL